MNREQAKRWRKEITHWAIGGDLWYYDDELELWHYYKKSILFTGTDLYSYIIEDKHFEARKHFALGGRIGIKDSLSCDDILEITKPAWGAKAYVILTEPTWHSNLSSGDVVCWVSNDSSLTRNVAYVITSYRDKMYHSSNGIEWKYATPILPEELYNDSK